MHKSVTRNEAPVAMNNRTAKSSRFFEGRSSRDKFSIGSDLGKITGTNKSSSGHFLPLTKQINSRLHCFVLSFPPRPAPPTSSMRRRERRKSDKKKAKREEFIVDQENAIKAKKLITPIYLVQISK